jgi:SSS family solute:Na+ symporter
VYTARSASVFRKNAVVLPLYQLVVLFVFFVGVAAILVVPGLKGADADLSLFRIAKSALPPWVVGMIGGAGLLTALVPGSMLLITAATILAKNVYRVLAPQASDHTVSVVARVLVPVLALVSLELALHGGQAIVALLLVGYTIATQLFPALILSLGARTRVSAVAAGAGILAGEATIAAMSVSGATLATLAPSAPQLVKDLNVGIVALVVNVVVTGLVWLAASVRNMASSAGASNASAAGA